MRKILSWCLCLMPFLTAGAKVTLPQLFQSGMVLQRNASVAVWGKADAGETVTILFNKKRYATEADENGHWRIDLPKMKAGGPYTMEVSGAEGPGELLTDILVGDVWLCSGQSNIDVTIERVYPMYTKEIDSYENPQIRLFRVQNDTDTHGVKDDIMPTPVNWKPLNKENAWAFSAVGYFLGKRMQEQTGVPQGIIVNSWGGTPIEAWLSADSLRRDYPLLLRKTQLYQDDSTVKSMQQTNNLVSKKWEEQLAQNDPGVQEAWNMPGLDDSRWPTVNQWDWQWPGVGSVWLRQHIQIDKAHAGQPARLLLGTLFDRDVTYLNGKQIGQTYYQYPPRRYDIPEGLLQEGDNVIAVRFINKYGKAHFIPEKPYLIAFGEDRCSQNPMPQDVIPLDETWRMHVGYEMPSCPSIDVTLQNLPTTLYNAVVHPLAPYALSGVVWYQGESNAGNPAPYADYLRKLMGGWRDLWENPQMPFVIVQLANYDGRQQTGFPSPLTPQDEPVNSSWAQLCHAQHTVAKEDPWAELAVINDLGETVDIHPLRKKEVAERIGLCLDRLVYHSKVRLSPEVVSAEVVDGQLVLTLDQPIQSGELHGFEIAGSDGIFQNVTSQGVRHFVRIDLTKCLTPCEVRYAWKDNPLKANVRSLSGLPMSAFELTIDN